MGGGLVWGIGLRRLGCGCGRRLVTGSCVIRETTQAGCPWSRSRVSLSIYLYPTVHPVFPPDPSLPARGGCASARGWSGGGGGLAVALIARLGCAVHPLRRPEPRGEPSRGPLASCEGHCRCTAVATPERRAHGCASVRCWSGGGAWLALLWPCVSILLFPRDCSVVASLPSLRLPSEVAF